MNEQTYYLGITKDTKNIGWAVTDEGYNILRAKGNDMWGVRQFEEAETNQERRLHSSARRTNNRKKMRICILREYFYEEIKKVDPYFFVRLDNSKYHVADKDENVQDVNIYFNDANYNDSLYKKEYPTIYHLRADLIHNSKPHDVRLVFLALLNMFKKRGHFYFEGILNEGMGRDFNEMYRELNSLLLEEKGFAFRAELGTEVEKILLNTQHSRSLKANKIVEIMELDKKDKIELAFIKLLCGLKVSSDKLFTEENTNGKVDICFSDSSYDEAIQEIETAIGSDNLEIITLIKEMYDTCVIKVLMGEHQYLSDARVESYNKHHEDLFLLKRVVRKYCTSEQYSNLFKKVTPASYTAYVKNSNYKTRQRRGFEKTDKDSFYKSIKKLLENVTDDSDVEYIRKEIEIDRFLPKQVGKDNAYIPNQVHALELKAILKNAETYLPFLNEIDESGLTVSKRIEMLFSFCVPYYVGPLTEKSETSGGNGWVVRKAEGQVLPWNLNEKVDVPETAKRFIMKMVRRCNYMTDEQVLPKCSLLYQSYSVLNIINAISIDGARISVDAKKSIYTNLFMKGKRVTKKQIFNHLKKMGLAQDIVQITGIDDTIGTALTSYAFFKNMFGEKLDSVDMQRRIEEIIFFATVYGSSKALLKESLKKDFSDILTEDNIEQILKASFKDWGNLSRAFLLLDGCDKLIGEKMTLIEMMWNTNYNLMEIVYEGSFTYKEYIEKQIINFNRDMNTFTVDDLDDYYLPAPKKRMVWQLLCIIREITEIMGCPPARLFIETAKNPMAENERSISRKQFFLNLYKKIKDNNHDWKAEIESADANGTLRSKKMYLYFSQMGRCMYTGEPINVDELLNSNRYNIDHIYPKHFVRDNSLTNNMVLVDSTANKNKDDLYPVPTEIYMAQKTMWQDLFRKQLISEEKYYRLVNRDAFTDEQLAGFISKQMNDKTHTSKAIGEIIGSVLPQTKIAFVKQELVSDFRQKNGYVRNHIVNEFYHSQDAYLNIVIGNVYYVKFTKSPINFIKDEYRKQELNVRYNLNRMFEWDVVRGSDVAWNASKEHGSIKIIEKMLKKNSALLTRRSYENKGALSKATIFPATVAKDKVYMPLKGNDKHLCNVEKYGGYNNITTAYFAVVESTEKGKRVRSIEAVNSVAASQIKSGKLTLERLFSENGLEEPSIVCPYLKIGSLLKKDGYFCYLSGRQGSSIIVRNAVSLILDANWNAYISKVNKYVEDGYFRNEISSEANDELYELLVNKHENGIFAKRIPPMGSILRKGMSAFKDLDVLSQCKVLLEVLKLSKIGVSVADLSLIGGAGRTGTMIFNKKLSKVNELVYIRESVTGLKKEQIDLLNDKA